MVPNVEVERVHVIQEQEQEQEREQEQEQEQDVMCGGSENGIVSARVHLKQHEKHLVVESTTQQALGKDRSWHRSSQGFHFVAAPGSVLSCLFCLPRILAISISF